MCTKQATPFFDSAQLILLNLGENKQILEIKSMSLIHACVAYGGTILAESSVGKRDFSQGKHVLF